MPDGLAVDTYEGTAWVSLTPFLMAGVRPSLVPGRAPGLPTFPETGLRTFVRGPDGRDGLWFLSLEVSFPAMLGARAIGASYHVGRLSVSRSRDGVRYSGSRRGAGPSYRLSVRPGASVRPTPPDVWQTSRWPAFTGRAGMVGETPVEHEPWPLREVAVDLPEQDLTGAVGLPPPAAEPVARYSDGVRRVRTGGSRTVHGVRGAGRRAAAGR